MQVQVQEAEPGAKIHRRRSGVIVTSHLLGGQTAVAVFALVVNVFAARAMGPASRGELALLLQVSYVLAAIGLAGRDRAYPASIEEALPLSATIRDIRRLLTAPTCAAAICAAFTAVALVNDPLVAVAAASLALLTLGNIATAGLRAASSAASAGGLFLRANLVAQASLLGAAAALALVPVESATTWLAAYAICIAIPVLFVAFKPGQRRSMGPAGQIERISRARRLGLKVAPSTLASIILLRADRLILPWLATYEQLGLYIIVATLCELVVWPVQAWVDAHMPAWHRMHLSGTLRRGRILCTVTLYAACCSIAMIIGCRLLIVPMFGSEYRSSLGLVAPLSIASSLYAVSRAAIGLALATNRPVVATISDLSAMVTAVALYIILIPKLGAMGAALGSLAGYGVAALIAMMVTALGTNNGRTKQHRATPNSNSPQITLP